MNSQRNKQERGWEAHHSAPAPPASLSRTQSSPLPAAPLPGPNRINSEHLLVLGARDEAP